MRGIILAGGLGTRLHPLTLAVSKQLLPVYNKPMIYYPLSVLMLAGIRDILLITTPDDKSAFQHLLADGSQWGLNLSYAVQPSPKGLPQALLIGEQFLAGAPSCLILGDNLFYGAGLRQQLQQAAGLSTGALIFGYPVKEPHRYGVVEFDSSNKILSLEEKPSHPRSHYAVPGLYFFDSQAPQLAKTLQPSSRGEMEITDLLRAYLLQNQLRLQLWGRGTAWLDAGTHESLLQAQVFVQALEERQGMMISCPEEIAWRMGFINTPQLQRLAQQLSSNNYGQYLLNLLNSPPT